MQTKRDPLSWNFYESFLSLNKWQQIWNKADCLGNPAVIEPLDQASGHWVRDRRHAVLSALKKSQNLGEISLAEIIPELLRLFQTGLYLIQHHFRFQLGSFMQLYPVTPSLPAHRNLVENGLTFLFFSQENQAVVDFCHVQINLFYKLKTALNSEFHDTHSSVSTFLNTYVLA